MAGFGNRMIINFDVELNSKGINKNIVCVADDETLIKNGFTNHHKPTMYWSSNLGNEIVFSIGVNIATRTVEIDILDDSFCQPYDYQAMIERGSTNKIVLEVHNKVQAIMKKLLDKNIISGYTIGDYI